MMDDYEEIRRRKLEEYQRRLQEKAEEESELAARQAQIDAIISAVLEPDARSRLANVRLANPKLAEKVIATLVYLYQAGRLTRKVTDKELKAILLKLSQSKRDTNIKILRK